MVSTLNRADHRLADWCRLLYLYIYKADKKKAKCHAESLSRPAQQAGECSSKGTAERD